MPETQGKEWCVDNAERHVSQDDITMPQDSWKADSIKDRTILERSVTSMY
jgi:hypothetical protein